MNRTKIIATVGPGCDNTTELQKLVELGVSCFRINLSHGSMDEKKNYFDLILNLLIVTLNTLVIAKLE